MRLIRLSQLLLPSDSPLVSAAPSLPACAFRLPPWFGLVSMSEALAPGEPASSVSVSPDQIKIDIELDREVFLDLTLTNNTDQLATFKVGWQRPDQRAGQGTRDERPRARADRRGSIKCAQASFCRLGRRARASNAAQRYAG